MRLNRGGTTAARPSERTQQVSSAVFGTEAKPLQAREAHAHIQAQFPPPPPAPRARSTPPHSTPSNGDARNKSLISPLLPPPISKPAPDHSAQSHCSTCRGQPSALACTERLPKGQRPNAGLHRLRASPQRPHCHLLPDHPHVAPGVLPDSLGPYLSPKAQIRIRENMQ